MDSLINSDKIETEESNKKVDKVEKFEEAVTIIKECKEIIRKKNENILCIAYHVWKVLRRFKENEKFIKLVNEFNVHKTIYTNITNVL